MKEYYYLIADHGDGSNSVRWFRERSNAQQVLENDEYDTYWSNEDGVNVVEAHKLRVIFED